MWQAVKILLITIAAAQLLAAHHVRTHLRTAGEAHQLYLNTTLTQVLMFCSITQTAVLPVLWLSHQDQQSGSVLITVRLQHQEQLYQL